MSHQGRDEKPDQFGFSVVDSSNTPLVFMNADSEIFVFEDGTAKLVSSPQPSSDTSEK